MVSKKWIPQWCQNIDAVMVSCIHDAVTVSCSSEDWDTHQDGVSTPWALHEYGQAKSWLLGHVFWGLKAPRFKGNKHQKEHPKSSMVFPTLTIWHPWSTFCLIALDPIYNYPYCYWLFSEVPNPTKHVCPWMKTVTWGVPWKFEDTISGIPPWHLTVLFLAPSRRQ
jgi:hypothetical protein